MLWEQVPIQGLSSHSGDEPSLLLSKNPPSTRLLYKVSGTSDADYKFESIVARYSLAVRMMHSFGGIASWQNHGQVRLRNAMVAW